MSSKAISSCCIVLLLSFSGFSQITRTLPGTPVEVRMESNYAVFSGSAVYGEPGEPALPFYTYTFLLPPDADLENVEVTINALAEEILPGEFEVTPGPPLGFQSETFWPEGKTIVDGKDISIYSSATFFPQTYTKIITHGKMWRYKLVQVEVNPYRYNPVSKKLNKMTGGNLTVSFPTLSQQTPVIKMPYGITQLVRKLVDNYSEIAPRYGRFESSSRPEKRGLAIITTSTIQSGSQNLQAYIDSKDKNGYKVHLVPESEWNTGSGDKCDKIRRWLKTNYENLGIEFALLIGDPTPSSGDVPMKKSGSTPTEWYYGELSGTNISSSDVFAEVHVGRFPVYSSGDIQKLDKIIEKTIAYENADDDEIGWRFKALLSMKPIDSKTQSYELGEQIKDNTLVPCGWEYYRVYDKDYSLNPPPEKTPVSSTNTQNAWKNEKPGCVFWDTHGQSTSSSGMIKVSEVSKLDDTHPVITFQGACLNAKPDVENNLCYSLLVHGAIATHGGTISVTYSPGESDYTNTGSIGGQNYWYAQYLIQDSLTTAESIDMARAKINGKKWNNHLALVLYGCPTVGPYSYARMPYIELVSPNGGVEWERDKTFDVNWNTNAEGEVKIELLRADTLFEILSNATSAEEPFPWAIPANFSTGTDYKVRVTSLENDTLIIESDDNFSITEKTTLALTVPNGAEYIEKDSDVDIKWAYSVDYKVNLSLYKDGQFEMVIVDAVENTGTYTWKVPKEISSGSDYIIRVASVRKPWLYDESDGVFSIQSPAITIFPYVQDFDDFDTGYVPLRDYWEQLDDDDFEWRVWTGPTPSKTGSDPDKTGPDGDHTTGNKNYIYVEASNPNNPSKKAHMLSPVFDCNGLKEGLCTFWYHMFSAENTMGDLYVDLCVDGQWTEGVKHFSGDKGDTWNKETIDLKDYTGKKIQFRFRGITGEDWCSDICIDDFSIDGEVNALPVYTTKPMTDGKAGEEYAYTVKAEDADGDALTFGTSTFPDWLKLTDNGDGTAEVKGTPDGDNVGDNDVIITVTDGNVVNPIAQQFTIAVSMDAPTITKDPDSQTVEETKTATFSIEFKGYVETFQWQKSVNGGAWETIPGAAENTYTTPVLALTDDGNKYRCIVSNIVGSDTSGVAQLKVTVITPIIHTIEAIEEYLSIYPNPAERCCDKVTFQLTVQKIRSAQLTIFDALGAEVFAAEFNNGTVEWNLVKKQGGKVSGGTYVALITLNEINGTISQYKTIIGIKGE